MYYYYGLPGERRGAIDGEEEEDREGVGRVEKWRRDRGRKEKGRDNVNREDFI